MTVKESLVYVGRHLWALYQDGDMSATRGLEKEAAF